MSIRLERFDECVDTDRVIVVLSQKLRDGLSLEMRDAFFLEVDTVGDLKKLLH